MSTMSNEQLAARAKLILRELGFRRPSILQSWMAQYVAECLAAAEQAPLTEPVRDTCASAIAQLWKLYMEDRKHRTARTVDTFRFRSSLDDKVLAALKAELSVENSGAIPLGPESAVQLRHLSLLEEHLLEVLWASTTVSDDGAREAEIADLGRDSKVAELLVEFREETKTTSLRIVAAVFPEFGALTLDDQAVVGRAVTIALRMVDKARRRRIWDENAAERSDRTDTNDEKS